MLKFEFICDICTTTWGERWISTIMLPKLWEKVGKKGETMWPVGGKRKAILTIPLLPNFCACIWLPNWPKRGEKILGLVWLWDLNNSFRCLNNTTRIFTALFHPHVYPQHLNNVTRTTLPNGPNCGNPISKYRREKNLNHSNPIAKNRRDKGPIW